MEQENSSIFNFKKFLIQILLPSLLLIAVLAYGFTRIFEKKIILGSVDLLAAKVDRIFTETHESEIPIFGSSRAATNFIT
ncbi:MAG: hypothetical protein JWQ19_4007, partial [Subtercola sp.]|nr:hypothetical protein [Subtercola sp.]